MVLNCDQHWLKGHYPNYLGLNGKTLVPDNYEADKGYFPLKWKQSLPAITLGEAGTDESWFYWKNNSQSPVKLITDYLAIIKGDNGIEINETVKRELQSGYNKYFENSKLVLYQLKKDI